MLRVIVLSALSVSLAACWTPYDARQATAPLAAPTPDWGGLGCATVRVVGDHVSGRSAEAVIEVTNVSGKDGCVVYVGISETVITTPGESFEVFAKSRVAVDAGQGAARLSVYNCLPSAPVATSEP